MINFYQHLPEKIDPIALHIGSFSIHWYSIMYLLGFLVAYWLLIYRLNKKEALYSKNLIADVFVYLIVGLLIGGRLGYVLFYNFSYYLLHPLAIISPFNSTGDLVGVYGMSYFGGLIGVILVGYVFCKKNKIYPVKSGEAGAELFNGVNFLEIANFIIPAIPAGYFFGRLGNFLNGELYGRMTEVPWGMYFADGILRHPSQLYEAFFEGLVIFIILLALRNQSNIKGQMLNVYLFLYGFFRFFIEFFREPDVPTSWITTGQTFSLILIIISVILYFRNYKKQVKL